MKEKQRTQIDKKQKNKENTEKRKKLLTTIAFIILIIIIILLLLKSCGDSGHTPGNTPTDGPQGSWDVGEQRPTPTQDVNIVPENITFSGHNKYTVSTDNKDIELTNPSVNLANFVFTVTDAQTNEIIAKTGKVAPGQYVYINLYDYFKKVGSYNVIINISAYSFAGAQLNGASTKAVITVG